MDWYVVVVWYLSQEFSADGRRSNLFFFLQFEIRRSTSSIGPFCPLSARVHASILSLYSTDCCSAPLTSLSFRQDCPRLRLGLPLLLDDQPASFFIFFPTVTTLLYFPRILGSPFKLVSTDINPAAPSSISISIQRQVFWLSAARLVVARSSASLWND